jgi:hypothetical protein
MAAYSFQGRKHRPGPDFQSTIRSARQNPEFFILLRKQDIHKQQNSPNKYQQRRYFAIGLTH